MSTNEDFVYNLSELRVQLTSLRALVEGQSLWRRRGVIVHE